MKVNFFFDHSEYSIDSHNVDEFRTFSRPDLRGLRWPNVDGSFESAGVEFLFDFRAFRRNDVNIGFRYSRLLSDQVSGKNHINFIFVSFQ